MKFEENLRELRKQNGLSQEELAEQLNVSRQAVSKWENGSGYPELDKLMALCEMFHCTMDDLLKGDVGEKDTASFQAYEAHHKTMSKAMAIGIFLLFSSCTAWCYLEPYFLGDQEVALQLIFFMFVTAGILTFIYYGMQSDTFRKKYPKAPQNIYREDDLNTFERKFRISLLFGVGTILLSLGVQQVLEIMVSESIANGTFLLMVSIAITNLVYFGTQKSKYDDTIPKTELELAKAKENEKIGVWCGCIMLFAAIIFLVWSFVFDGWSLSWLIFPIGGVLCGIVSILYSKKA